MPDVASLAPLPYAEALIVEQDVVRDGMPPGIPAVDQSVARDGSRIPDQDWPCKLPDKKNSMTSDRRYFGSYLILTPQAVTLPLMERAFTAQCFPHVPINKIDESVVIKNNSNCMLHRTRPA